jgi:dihydroorotate dehydrogenase, subfamily 2
MLYRTIARPILFRMDPELAHRLIVHGLGKAVRLPGALPLMRCLWDARPDPRLETELFGIRFRHPVGLAAGLDKDAVAVEGFAGMGLAFLEVGTVTPVGQPGNDRPRLFRLPDDEALINRMGFNNEGAEAMAARLARLKERRVPIAVNIGKNKATPNDQAPEDYRKCLRALYPYGDFFVINISSPNTPDLRKLQHGEELKALLDAVRSEIAEQAARTGGKPKPVVVKIAPDMTEAELEQTVGILADGGVSGIIATNTTLSRDGLVHPNRSQQGGLSGRPLRARSTDVIRAIYRLTGGRLPIIGSGGIFDARDAYDKIRAGASLVEVYTALIYKGPGVVRGIAAELSDLLAQGGFRRVGDAVGADHR